MCKLLRRKAVFNPLQVPQGHIFPREIWIIYKSFHISEQVPPALYELQDTKLLIFHITE